MLMSRFFSYKNLYCALMLIENLFFQGNDQTFNESSHFGGNDQ